MAQLDLMKSRLSKLRENHGLTQKMVAEYLNLTQQAYAAYESGISTPSIEVLILLSRLYKVSVDSIIGIADINSGKIKDENIAYQIDADKCSDLLHKVESLNIVDKVCLNSYVEFLLSKYK